MPSYLYRCDACPHTIVTTASAPYLRIACEAKACPRKMMLSSISDTVQERKPKPNERWKRLICAGCFHDATPHFPLAPDAQMVGGTEQNCPVCHLCLLEWRYFSIEWVKRREAIREQQKHIGHLNESISIELDALFKESRCPHPEPCPILPPAPWTTYR
jgi:hypothetical protein